MPKPRVLDLDDYEWDNEAPGVRARHMEIDGVRWTTVEYAPGGGRPERCETAHVGCCSPAPSSTSSRTGVLRSSRAWATDSRSRLAQRIAVAIGSPIRPASSSSPSLTSRAETPLAKGGRNR